MKISKDCGFEKGCFSTNPLNRWDDSSNLGDNYLSTLQDVNTYMVMLPDGISLGFQNSGSEAYSRIRVDIDGPNKGKNMVGSDIFDFILDIFNYNTGSDDIPLKPSYFYNDTAISQYETAWVIQNGNVDYLKADSTRKCNDSDIVLNWTTNTSCH